MAFDINANKRNLKRLSLDEGGGFVNFASNINRAKTVDDKILIIGSGGMGGKTVSKLKSDIYKHFEIPTGEDKPKNIEFLYLDSDVNDLNSACNKDIHGIGLSMDDTCQIYNPAAGGLFKDPDWYDKLKDHQKKWYNKNLSPVLAGKGAGGIRQASRYLLTSDGAFTKVVDNIENKFQKLMRDGLLPGSRIRVFLVAGIGGGTGSGTFIDLAYMIREIVNNNGWTNLFDIYGCLYLPDVYAISGQARYKIMENGYAALRELDYFMNIENLEDAGFDMKYSAKFEITNPKVNIFDNCILMTGSRAEVGSVVDSEVLCIESVSNFVIDIITKTTNKIGGKFMIDSFLDDKVVFVDGALDRMNNTPMNANFAYMVIGSSSITLPFEQISCYLGYKTMERIQNLWNKEPNVQEITNLINKLNIAPNKQYHEMHNRSEYRYTRPSSASDFTKEDVINGEIDRQVKNEIIVQNEKVYTSYDNIRHEIVTKILKEYSDYEIDIIKDISKGPNYLYMAIHGFVQNGKESVNGVIARIERDLKSEIDQYLNGETSSIQSMEEQKQKIKNSLSGRFSIGSNKKKIEEYLNLCYEIEFIKNGKKYIYEKINETLDEVIEYLKNRVYSYIQGYKETMEEIMKILKSNYDIVMDSTKTKEKFPNSLIDLSKADERNLRLKRLLDNAVSSKTDVELISEFADVILDHKDEWTSMESNIYNPGRSLVDFIEKIHSNILGKSVEEFLQDYMDSDFGSEVDRLCKKFIGDSEVFFKSNVAFSLGNLPTYKFAAVPKNAVQFKNKINALDVSINVYDSSDKNKISCIKYYIGVPLYAMENIQVYEKNYNKADGIHLNEADEYYGDLPALHNKKYYSLGYENKDEKAICDEISKNIDNMISEELVFKNTKYMARLLYNVDVDEEKINNFMNVYLNDDSNKENNLYLTKINLLRKFAEYNNLKIVEKVVKPKGSKIEDTVEGLKLATRMNWGLYKNMKSTLELYNKLKTKVDEHNNNIGTKIEFEKNIRLFKKCLDANLILKEANFWRYYINTDEKLTFTNYMEFEKIDRDYELFTCFNKFILVVNENHKDVLERLYQHRINNPNPEVGEAMMNKKAEIEKDAREKVDKLKSFEVEMDFLGKGIDQKRKELLCFYNKILEL